MDELRQDRHHKENTDDPTAEEDYCSDVQPASEGGDLELFAAILLLVLTPVVGLRVVEVMGGGVGVCVPEYGIGVRRGGKTSLDIAVRTERGGSIAWCVCARNGGPVDIAYRVQIYLAG